MAINIASFNVCSMSVSAGRKCPKDFSTMAKVILRTHADIVALQEVVDQDSINHLVANLQRLSAGTHEWRDSFKREKTHRNNREGYAVLWNERAVSLARDKDGEPIKPEIMTRYVSLKRPPMVARFRVHKLGELDYEICVINTHIVFNEDNYLHAHEHKDWYGANAMRALEYEKIVKDIYPLFSNHLCTYTVIAGDYNLSGLFMDKVNAIGNGKGDRPQMKTVQYQKSTIKTVERTPQSDISQCANETERKGGLFAAVYNGILSLFSGDKDSANTPNAKAANSDEKPHPVADGDYASNYDHFSSSVERVAGYVKKPHRLDIPASLFPLIDHRFHAYKGSISDHVPVVASLDLHTATA
jgi:hypothetical protein